MSGVVALRQVVLGALRGDGALMALVNGVEDGGGAARLSAPALLLGPLAASEWGAKGVDGLSVRVPLTLIDRADVPDRIDAATERIAAVMDGLAGAAGAWRIGVVRFERSRTVRGADGQWSVMIDYQVRLSRLL